MKVFRPGTLIEQKWPVGERVFAIVVRNNSKPGQDETIILKCDSFLRLRSEYVIKRYMKV